MTQTPLQQLLDLHRDTTDKCLSIMVAKNADYTAGSADPYANFRIAEQFGVHPAIGIVLRITDKLQRIRSFALSGKMAVKSESVDDACDDIVNYAILIKGLLRKNANCPLDAATCSLEVEISESRRRYITIAVTPEMAERICEWTMKYNPTPAEEKAAIDAVKSAKVIKEEVMHDTYEIGSVDFLENAWSDAPGATETK